MRGLILAIFAITGASAVATIAVSAIRVDVRLGGASSAAEISAAVFSSAIGAVIVVFVVTASAALMLCNAIVSPLARLAESFEHGGQESLAPRLRDAARLQAAASRLVAGVRSEEREAAAERERQLRGELAAAEFSAASAEARLGEFAPIAEALTRLARGDLTVRIAESHPLRSKLDQSVSLIAKTVLAFSASLGAIRGGAEEMNAAVEAYGEEISKLAARAEAAQSALLKRCEAAAELAAPLGASASLLRALAEDAALQGAGVRRGGAAFGEILQAAKRITPILTLVDEVAFQTNMLALNAGVEAARVGDAGRGMGVVAQELRLLARRAAQAAKESSGLLSSVLAQAERGAGELSTVESAYDALLERAQKILAVLERTCRDLADANNRREVTRTLSQPFAEAASARVRLKDEMTGETEALESLIGKLSDLIDRFKLETDYPPEFRPRPAKPNPSVDPRGLPPPVARRAQRLRGHQNNS